MGCWEENMGCQMPRGILCVDRWVQVWHVTGASWATTKDKTMNRPRGCHRCGRGGRSPAVDKATNKPVKRSGGRLCSR